MKKLCLLAAIAFSSCLHVDKAVFVDETDTTVIGITSKPTNRIRLDTFVDSVKFVKLETTEECLIHRIANVFVAEGKIILPDYKTHEIYIFDESGKYLSKISRRGRGPQEYIGMSAAMFNPKTQNIMVYSLQQTKLLFYDLDGMFIREIPDFSDKMLIRDIINTPNGNYLCYDGLHTVDGNIDKIGLWEVDSNGKFLKWLLKPQGLHPVISNVDPINLYYRNGYEIGFWDNFTDDDFHYVDGTLKRIRTYDLPLRRGKDIPGVYNTDEKFTIRAYLVDKGNYALAQWYDFKDNKSITILHSVGNDTVLSGAVLDYNTPGINALPGAMVNNNLDDVFVEVLNSLQILWHKESTYLPLEAIEILNDLTKGMSEKEIENMNPILEFYYLKKSENSL